MKNKIIGMAAALIVMIGCVLINVLHSNRVISDNEKNVMDDKEVEVKDKKDDTDDGKKDDVSTSEKRVAVVYFSATGTTKKIAEYINESVDGTLFEIVPADVYTEEDLDYNNNNSRSYLEGKDVNSRPKIKNKINLDSYDVVYLGYPVWYTNVPRIIFTFIDNTNINGKTIIPFCSSLSTDITTSLNTLKTYKSDVTWGEGKRLTDNKEEVTSWVSSLKY